LKEIKSLGWQNAMSGRMSGLTGKKKFQNFIESYSSMQNEQGLFPLTFEVIYGHVWAPEIKSNEAYVSVSDIRRQSSTS